MNIPDYRHEQNRRDRTMLEELGFRIEVTPDRYQVWFEDQYIDGASVKLPRAKPLHWRHRDANMRDNLDHAVCAAKRSRFATELAS